MKKTKIYLDTTIINFIHADDAKDYKQATIDFFEKSVKSKEVDVYISNVVFKEIYKTQNTEKLNKLLGSVKEYDFEVLESNLESNRLSQIYLAEKIIPANKVEDAEHIGIATVYEMDILLSCPARAGQHLANYNRKQKVKVVNIREKYFYPLDIISPLELEYERD